MEIKAICHAEILGAPNAAELTREYAAECSIPQIGPIDPQADLYARMEASGNFQAFGMFEGERLIGFASALVYTVPHYGRRVATVESIFLERAHRNGRNGNALMNAIEGYAKEGKCEAILYSARTGSQFERLLTLRRPYERTNSVFLRILR